MRDDTLYVVYFCGDIFHLTRSAGAAVYEDRTAAVSIIESVAVYKAKRHLWETERKHFDLLSEEDQGRLVQEMTRNFKIVEFVPKTEGVE